MSPGPWSFIPCVDSLYLVRDANGNGVCAVMPENAPAIAAGPDMLIALEAAERELCALRAAVGSGVLTDQTIALVQSAVDRATRIAA